MKKVCIYCRVNSPEQAEGTAERMAKQIERCRNVADLHNFTVVDEMRDFCGHSMEEVNRRRALNEMIAKARRGEFNSVVIPSLKVLSLDADVAHGGTQVAGALHAAGQSVPVSSRVALRGVLPHRFLLLGVGRIQLGPLVVQRKGGQRAPRRTRAEHEVAKTIAEKKKGGAEEEFSALFSDDDEK